MTRLEPAGSRRTLKSGERLYEQGELAETVFVLLSGQVELRTVRRGDAVPSAIRSARRGDRFGEECVLDGARRSSSAFAVEPSVVMETPIAVYRRLGARSGELELAERRLKHAVVRDALLASVLGQSLRQRDIDDISAECELVRVRRGERLYAAGDPASAGYVLADGLVRLDGGSVEKKSIFAYLSRGDLFGDDEVIASERRALAAMALGDSLCLALPAAVLRRIDHGYPGLLLKARRVLAGRQKRQLQVVSQASSQSTAHVFKDLYRLQIARSLLAIDLESCVRCGHCAYACADVHGVSRLVRRGDKVVTRIGGDTEASPAGRSLPKSLLLPNSCQHCENAACMVECPTGAIGRDENGEVFIREELCTGCGACAKACPWENIQMAPRPETSAEIAVKCDLCRGKSAPACVTACPTEAIMRVDPNEAFDDVRALLGRGSRPLQTSRPASRSAGPMLALSSAGLLALLAELGRRSAALEPGRGAGLVFGIVAAVLVVSAAAYAVPKRLVRWWLDLRPGAARSIGTRTLFWLHVGFGGLAFAALLGHAGFGSAKPGYLPLTVSLWTALVSGVLAAVSYRWLPKLLAPIERTGLLPEDFAAERRRLLENLESRVSQRSDVVKALFSKLLLPHAESAAISARLVLARNGLGAEERALRARVETLLPDRARDRLEGLDSLIRSAVELSALRARRVLTALLRGLALAHGISSLVFVLLLAVHVIGRVIGRLWLWGAP